MLRSAQQVEIKNKNVQKKYEVKNNFNKWRILKDNLRQKPNQDDIPSSDGTTTTTSRSLWSKLKQAIMKRKGLIEIDPQHANYEFTRKSTIYSSCL